MTDLRVNNLSVPVEGCHLVKGASYTLRPGELIVLLGPNGAGKTSLLRASLGLIRTDSGKAELGDQQSRKLSSLQRAKRVSYLPQTRPLAWPNRVRDVVTLGRFAFGTALGRLSEREEQAVVQAMEACDIQHLADRQTNTLSGGELARVHLARAFAAETPLLIADEPVAGLDPRHQFRVMDLFKDYVRRGGGVLVVLHDIALAARYADRMIWMQSGEIVADGTPQETLTEQRLEEIYGIRAEVNGLDVRFSGVS